MTERVVCAVWDSAMQSFGQPIFVVAVGQAIRSFIDEVNRPAPDNQLSMHPEDFELHVLATYEDTDGKFRAPPEGVQCVMRGKDAKKEIKHA